MKVVDNFNWHDGRYSICIIKGKQMTQIQTMNDILVETTFF